MQVRPPNLILNELNPRLLVHGRNYALDRSNRLAMSRIDGNMNDEVSKSFSLRLILS